VRRAAAVVPYAPQQKACWSVGVLGNEALHLCARPAQRRVVPRYSPVAHDLRSVVSDPDELVVGQVTVALGRAAEDVAIVPTLGHDLHQAAGVPERIEVDRCGWLDTELLLEVASAHQNLAHERFAAGHVTVRLQEPAPHHVPAPLAYEPLDSPEQLRFKRLYPLVEQGLIVVEDEAIEGLAQVCRRAKCGDCFSSTLFPFPKPNRVDMRVAQKVHAGSCPRFLSVHRSPHCRPGRVHLGGLDPKDARLAERQQWRWVRRAYSRCRTSPCSPSWPN